MTGRPVTETLTIADLKERDAYRAHGTLVECAGCGVVVRRIELEDGGTLDVAPWPMRGNWDRPLRGFGEGRADGREPDGPDRAVLYTFPSHVGRAQDDGWKGGARRFDRPPATAEGYRDHSFDCPGKG